MADVIQVRRDTAANWTSEDPTLAQGEIAFETDTNKLKLGDGATAWNSLAYFGGDVNSVFGRTGTVTAAASDYDASQVDNNSGVSGAYVSDALDALNSGKAAASHAHNASDISAGQFADARIAQSNVTQHQAAVSINASQVTAGALVHERGGLEADVSAYNGLLRVAGGVTSAIAFLDEDDFTSNSATAVASQQSIKAYVDSLGSGTTPIYIHDEKTTGTSGGTFTSGAWQTRDLNTLTDPGGHCTLSSNQFTLDEGTYEVQARCPAYHVNWHKARLYNISDSAVELVGSSEYTASTLFVSNASFIAGRLTVPSGGKTYELQHRCDTTYVTHGFGSRSDFTGAAEIYSTIVLYKVA